MGKIPDGRHQLTAIVIGMALILSSLFVFSRRAASVDSPVFPAGRPVDAPVTPFPRARGKTGKERGQSSRNENNSNALSGLTFANAWDREQRPTFLAFKNWTDRYFTAKDSGERNRLLAEGVALAKNRRAEMLKLIRTDPKSAIDESVPAAIRALFPNEIATELETRVSGQGDLLVIARTAFATGDQTDTTVYREVTLDKVRYDAYVYGQRIGETTKRNIPLNGIVVDGQMAVHESGVRALESNESLDAGQAVITLDDSITRAGETTHTDSVTLAAAIIQIAGQYAVLPRTADAQVLDNYFSKREAGINPKVSAVTLDHTLLRTAASQTSVVARALPPLTWTTGNKKVLVAFFDFSDLPGFPTDASTGQKLDSTTAGDLFTSAINPYYIETSYNKTSLTATIDSHLYRLPKSASTYAGASTGSDDLMADARALLKENPDSYDRYIIVFSNLSGFGSNITYGGQGYVGESGVWINGFFDLPTVAHELGHNYGLSHANLWLSNTGNPSDTDGSSTEYGDNYDIMGNGRDARAHFNMWHKYQLGWLPDKATTTITKSGTYRVYRFDDANASFNNPLALRIVRDATRTYWIGLRKKYTDDDVSNGAYIVWGYADSSQPSDQLHIFGQPSLQLGAYFEDDTAGFSIKTLAAGGSAPNEYLDIQVLYLGTKALPATGITPTGFTAHWSPDPDVADYFLDVASDANFYYLVDRYSNLEVGNTSSYVITGLQPNTTYYYRIREGVTGLSSLNTNTITVSTGQAVNSTVIRAHSGDTVSLPQLTSPNGSPVYWLRNSWYQYQLDSNQISNATLQDAGFYRAGFTSSSADTYLKSFFVVISNPASDLRTWSFTSSRFDDDPTANSLHDLAQVAVGTNNMAVLKGDGTIYEWGDNSHGQNNIPAGLNDVVRVALGTDFSLALRGDGTVAAWGLNDQGQCTVPADLHNVVSIAAGADFGIAVKSDGSVAIWGATATPGATTLPADITSIAMVAASDHTICAVGTNGQLWRWALGSAQDNFMGVEENILSFTTSSNEMLSVTYPHSAFGSIFNSRTNPIPDDLVGTLDIAASTSVDLAIDVYSGNIEAWGPNASQITPVSNALAVAAGTNAAAAIVRDPGLPYFPDGAITGPGTVTVSGGTFSVNVANAAGYQWQGSRDGGVSWSNLTDNSNFAGTTSTSLTVSNVSISLNGEQLRLVATGSSGSNTTASVTLNFSDPTLSRLINLSTRSFVGTGPNVQIAGFIVGGNQPKTVLIRAGGPSLTPFGVAGVLEDPVLTLYSGETVIGSNDDWDASTLQAAFTARQTSMWTVGSKDAAMIVTLPPGGYTAKVTGKNGQTGVALVEIFEYDTAPTVSKLVNLSTRSYVGTGPNIQIAGFIVSGSSPKHVLIRAGGPSLLPYGVANTLADPVLNVYSGQTIIASNDNWDYGTISPVANSAGVPAWASGSADAAVYLTLNPGGYTAQVTGKNGGTGVALIEVFELP